MKHVQMIDLSYKDVMNRAVSCVVHVFEDEEARRHLVFLDRSAQHGGMSLTNSIEQAISAFINTYGGFKTTDKFYETYDMKNFDRIEFTCGWEGTVRFPQWFHTEMKFHYQ
jgi:hypothetical protein